MSLNANRAALLADLELIAPAGWTVTGDPRTVHPPCVLVGHPVGLERAACGLAGVVPVLAIVAGPGNADALTQLLDVVELLAGQLDLAGPVNPTTYYTDPTGETGLPAYSLDVHLTT